MKIESTRFHCLPYWLAVYKTISAICRCIYCFRFAALSKHEVGININTARDN